MRPLRLLLAGLACLPACGEEPAPRARAAGPSLILITIDTLRADHLGVYGYPRATSPFLDQLAHRAQVFQNAFVQWPKTSPSMASMLTGLYGHATGVRKGRTAVPEDLTLLAERLRAARYETLAVVSNPNLHPGFGFAQGFDQYRATWDEELAEPAVPARGSDCDAARVTRHALQLLDERSPDSGFFLWAHYIDPHTPYTPPEPHHEMFVNDELFVGEMVLEPAPEDEPQRSVDVINRTALLGEERRLDYYVAQYDAEIRAVDEHLERLFQGLEERGVLDNALVIITADHGESLGEHRYFFEHGRFVYEPSCRVPLLVLLAGQEPRHIRQVVGLIDLVPTVLDYLGLPGAEELPGTSWRSLMEGQGEDSPPFVFTEGGYPEEFQRAVRSQRWKMIYVPDRNDQRVMSGQEFELYDLRADPGETRNLVRREKLVAQRLEQKLREWVRTSARATRAPIAPRDSAVDDVSLARLEALGYVE